GLRAATLRQLAKEYRELPLSEVEALLRSEVHEERSLALLILGLIVHRAPDPTRKQVYDFYLANACHVNSWDLVDVSAPPLRAAPRRGLLGRQEPPTALRLGPVAHPVGAAHRHRRHAAFHPAGGLCRHAEDR